MNRFLLIYMMIGIGVFLVIGCSSKGEQDAGSLQLIVPHELGGRADSVARLIATALEQKTEKSISIKNIAGTDGKEAFDYVYKTEEEHVPIVFANTLEGVWALDCFYENEWNVQDWKTVGIYAEIADMGLVTSANERWTDFVEFIEEARLSSSAPLTIGLLGPGRFDQRLLAELERVLSVQFTWEWYEEAAKLEKAIEREDVDAGVIQTQAEEFLRRDSLQLLTVLGTELPDHFPYKLPLMTEFAERLQFDADELDVLTMPTMATLLVKATLPKEEYTEIVQLFAGVFTDPSWQEVMPLYATPIYYSPEEAEQKLKEANERYLSECNSEALN